MAVQDFPHQPFVALLAHQATNSTLLALMAHTVHQPSIVWLIYQKVLN
jgi:hypothetical protein